MEFDAAILIRAGSGLLFVLLACAILIIGRGARRPLALALFLGGIGSEVIVANFNGRNSLVEVRIELALSAIASVGALALAWSYPSRGTRRTLPAIFAGLAVGLVSLAGVVAKALDTGGVGEAFGVGHVGTADTAWIWASLGAFIVVNAGTLVALAIRLAGMPGASREDQARIAAITAVMGPYFIVYLPTISLRGSLATLAAALALVLGLTIPWLVVAARTGSRLALAAALAWSATGLLAFAYPLVPANNAAAYFDAFGLFGILRVAGWVILVHAILRRDLLGVPLPHFAVSRGALAAGALATLFIVAQVAQNFFSAQFGLLTGGIVAGTFLFAAAPLQRAMERLSAGREAREGPTPAARAPNDVARRESVYLNAARLAMRDRRLTRDEEAHLHALAEELGLGAKRAHELLVQAEREAGVA